MNYSWSPVGEALAVPYEAPQGRRVNAIGGYFSAGPQKGTFVFETRARVPQKKNRPASKKAKKSHGEPSTAQALAAIGNLAPQEIGVIDAEVLVSFVWNKIAGRPQDASGDWRRERPVVIVLDNYSWCASAP